MQKDIEFYRQEYKKQKKLEQIVNSRVLVKPKIKKWQVTALFVILPFLLFACIFLPLISKLSLLYKVLIPTLACISVFEIYLRLCLICLVKLYQARAKKDTRKRCKCIPSCSEYAILSLKKLFPLLLALLKIRKRLFVTCDGQDYKIDFPIKRMSKEYENKL